MDAARPRAGAPLAPVRPGGSPGDRDRDRRCEQQIVDVVVALGQPPTNASTAMTHPLNGR